MAMNPNRAAGRPSRNTVLVVVGAAVAIAAVFIVAALLLRDSGSTSASPTPVVDLGGIPQEGTFLGSPDAKVTLIEYADIQCPACRAYTEEIFPTFVDEYVRPGKVRAEFRGFPFLDSGDTEGDSLRGERFLLAAAKQNKMFELMEALYRNQGVERSGWLTDDLVRELASEIPGLDVDQLFADAESEEIAQAAQQSLVDAQQAGISATPTLIVQVGADDPYQIVVGSPDQLREALDAALQS
jgi:protein-disulfide isomerase